jgi:hypothetical protein
MGLYSTVFLALHYCSLQNGLETRKIEVSMMNNMNYEKMHSLYSDFIGRMI